MKIASFSDRVRVISRDAAYVHCFKDVEALQAGSNLCIDSPIGDGRQGLFKYSGDSLLDEALVKKEVYFLPNTILQIWAVHSSGVHNLKYQSWNVFKFQAWMAEQVAPYVTLQRNSDQ
jgi:hypothetical protein